METLLSLADPAHAHLLLPRLGEPLEPSERRPARPWWRSAATGRDAPVPASAEENDAAAEDERSASLPWPLD